jgi:protease I
MMPTRAPKATQHRLGETFIVMDITLRLLDCVWNAAGLTASRKSQARKQSFLLCRETTLLPAIHYERLVSLREKTILFFAGPLYEDLELWYPKIRLEEEGARTVVAGTGEKTYQGKRGYPITVDTSVDQIAAADFDGLVIPGGYAPDIMRRSPKLLQITREIYQAGKPVAFICHAGWVPISAGIVRGRRGTSVGAIKDDLVNAGLIWEDSAVVVDGNLISSRTPADLPQFCRALIAALEKSGVGNRESGVRGKATARVPLS